jgi:sulfate adenylyltransferase large subunit
VSDLLRFATAGSVDDGKSTLIGRLLHDTKALFDDHLDAVASASARRGHEGLDLSLVTDGLRAEREQGITIDVAYRYFATPRRTFIIADTPGHARYTRNMVTGASTADVAVVLVDARHGLVEQSRRHALVAATLGIPRVVLAVNKMDLVGWSEDAFDDVTSAFDALADGLGFTEVVPIPMSALLGDNVVDRSEHLDWYAGPTLLGHLETVAVDEPAHHLGARLPVQWVVRPRPGSGETRRYAGSVAAGILRPGDDVVVLPSGERTRVVAVETADGPLEAAEPQAAITVRLADDLDVGRGDLLAHPSDAPTVARELEATVCWFDGKPVRSGDRLLLKHTTRLTRAVVRELVDRVDVDSLDRHARPAELAMNDLGTVRLGLANPLAVDLYTRSRVTGSFILIDEATNHTVGAGMITAA